MELKTYGQESPFKVVRPKCKLSRATSPPKSLNSDKVKYRFEKLLEESIWSMRGGRLRLLEERSFKPYLGGLRGYIRY